MASNDDQVENVHFNISFPPEAIGYKLIASNVSDILACGGKPHWINISLAAPKDIDIQWLIKLYDGINKACKKYGVSVIGGNTTSAEKLHLGAYILGTTKRFIPRSGARKGELLFVSAPLGLSRYGLQKLLIGECDHPAAKAHLYPKPPVKLLPLISKYASSAIDISDGFCGDLAHIIEQSKVGFEIYNTTALTSKKMVKYIGKQKAESYALNSGEEYQLIFTIPPKYAAHAKRYNLTPIGAATAAQQLIINGSAAHIKSFNHF